MERGEPFIRMTLDIDQAIELGEFVGAFTALASEYERYAKANFPADTPPATLFVKRVRSGSIEADLIPWLIGGGLLTVATGSVAVATAYNTIDDFVERLGKRLKTYTRPGGRVRDASKGELKDFLDQIGAVATNPDSKLKLAAMELDNGEERTRVVFEFDTNQAREIRQRVEEHRLELEHTSRADHERVLMTFVRSDIRGAKVGRRSGELVEISDVSDKPLALIYASELAEQKIKSEIADDESVYRKGFVVDVNVQVRGAKPVAYAVTNLHQIIDLPEY